MNDKINVAFGVTDCFCGFNISITGETVGQRCCLGLPSQRYGFSLKLLLNGVI